MTPQTISHYKILSKLGAGGMGEVYLAEDTKLGRKVGIKFLAQELVEDEVARKRLIREAQAAATLDHPNICGVYEVGEEDGLTFIVMQYVEGQTLAERMQSKHPETREILELGLQIAEALSEAHGKGIMHRDVKPQNVLVNSRGQVKVMDFGLAKSTAPESNVDSQMDTRTTLTQTGSVVGTLLYMSPEQLRGEKLDTRSDTFSFGTLLYVMVSGHHPFAGTNQADTISAILTRDPPLLSRYAPDLPLELQRIISKAMSKDREKRYQSMKDLSLDLRTLRDRLEFEAKLVSSELTSGQSRISGQIPTRKRFMLYHALLAALAIGVGAFIVYKFAGRGEAIQTLAVLPFVNVNADPDVEYLVDGITESLINSLSQLKNFTVMSRSSVFRYKGREGDVQAAGKELNVQAVLTGRVIRRGDELAISTELVDVRKNTSIWGDKYNRKMVDILAIQEEISREISENLRIELSGEEKHKLAKRYTDNPKAYELYLKGRYFWNKRRNPDYLKSRDYFQQAIELDPSYSLGYAGLADFYGFLAAQGLLPPQEAWPKAEAAALKALELDDSLAEAHHARAAQKLFYYRDFQAAEQEFRKTLEINPKYAETHLLFGLFLNAMGRKTEALGEHQRAAELDPLNLRINQWLGTYYYYHRDFDRAISEYKKTLEMYPEEAFLHELLARAYGQKGSYDAAFSEWVTAFKLMGDTEMASALQEAYRLGGHRQAVQAVWHTRLERLTAKAKGSYVSMFEIADAHMRLGDREKAVEYLQIACSEKTNGMILMKLDPIFDPIRKDPRFAAIERCFSEPG
ncbi:tetratricopeptide repeat-containing serine/threonine-protein kinase [bacterium]|nr:tetratricopeptide repeat-containing serine/threonine-protein kinase [bacterium]